MREENRQQSVRPFTNLEYALIVLYGLKRMIRRTDYYQSFIPPRVISRGSADTGEVSDILEKVIELVKDRIEVEVEDEQEREMRHVHNRPAD